MQKLLTRQADGRLALGNLAKFRRYYMVIEPDGTVILTPVKNDDQGKPSSS